MSDVLFVLLQRLEDAGRPPRIPVFGTSSAQRVELAQADLYPGNEDSEWGKVPQTKIQFRNRLTALTLLREVWTGHPSARPALIDWLRRLAVDARALVRNRAASTAAALAEADLLSTLALLIQPWAADKRFRARLAAANSLALASHLGVPHVPQILRTWCSSDDHRLRWTAVRAYGLVGDTFPAQAIEALVEAVRAVDTRTAPGSSWPEEVEEIAQSAATLLLAAGQSGVVARAETQHDTTGPDSRDTADSAPELWTELVPLLRDRTTQQFVLWTVVHACGPTDGGPGFGRPLLLDLLARWEDVPGTPGALLSQSLAALLRAVLNDPGTSESGLTDMRDWVRAAAFDTEAEDTLALLLPRLVVAGEDAERLAYLLDKLRFGETEEPVQAAARRLRSVLTQVDGTGASPPVYSERETTR
ncbi:hypothetical protein [Yinghuangia soli]|uniref:HEAT repeat domain-containing protein n=1 Tax=Yinghuangia soli TaxID=2908204 RepID=A0AA41Q6S9_9ACTN|nr:hypothetical protein [Yinghuangia soli]MCF2532630.1 hypothetical protein [Yinghuangia soli]